MSRFWDWFKAQPGERKALMAFVLLIVLAMLAAWYDKTPTPSKQFTQAKPIQGTAVPKQDAKVANGTVKVIPKAVVKKAVELPPEVADDDDKEVTATAETPPSENGTKIISVIDKTTGNTVILTKENPVPLFAFENKRRLGVGYGVGSEGTAGKIFGEYTFLRVGNFHLGAQAELSSAATKGPEVRAQAILDYRW
jgi:hypothetical protein